jgi:hypothetical protein
MPGGALTYEKDYFSEESRMSSMLTTTYENAYFQRSIHTFVGYALWSLTPSAEDDPDALPSEQTIISPVSRPVSSRITFIFASGFSNW